MLQGIGTYLAKLLRISLHETLLTDLLIEHLAMRLVVVAEDGLTKLLHLSNDVPGTVIVNLLHDVAE